MGKPYYNDISPSIFVLLAQIGQGTPQTVCSRRLESRGSVTVYQRDPTPPLHLACCITLVKKMHTPDDDDGAREGKGEGRLSARRARSVSARVLSMGSGGVTHESDEREGGVSPLTADEEGMKRANRNRIVKADQKMSMNISELAGGGSFWGGALIIMCSCPTHA